MGGKGEGATTDISAMSLNNASAPTGAEFPETTQPIQILTLRNFFPLPCQWEALSGNTPGRQTWDIISLCTVVCITLY